MMAITSGNGAETLILSTNEKESVQQLIEQLSKDNSHLTEVFFNDFAKNQAPVWQRYSNGIYNHPKTWWIGIIQVLMITGSLGTKRKTEAMLRQNALAQILHELLRSENIERTQQNILQVVRFNLKYRKSDIAGRFHGGMFTNYATMLGRLGKNIPSAQKWSARITNLTIASFGAAIQVIASGYNSPDAIMNAILTGNTERVPNAFRAIPYKSKTTTEEDGISSALLAEIQAVQIANSIESTPGPINEFCRRPENIKLKGLCR
jgi:hypothetical protein